MVRALGMMNTSVVLTQLFLHRELLDRVERLKKKEQEKAEMTEITEVIAKVASRKPFMNVNLALDEDSSSDDDSEDENALLDWRAKHF